MSERPTEDPLEEALRSSPRPRASATFERHLREAFVAGRLVEESSSPGSEDERTSDVSSESLEKRLSKALEVPPARAEFRGELRGTFVSGSLASRHPGATTVPGRRARGKLLGILVPLAAAAAILLVTLLPQDPGWEVSVEGTSVEVAGRVLEAGETDRIGAQLDLGAELYTRDSTVRLLLEGALEIEILPETRLRIASLPELPQVPERVEIDTGEAFFRKLGGPATGPLSIRTPNTQVEVLGTVLGVLADELGSCVCVCEGRVGVRHGGEAPVVVGAHESFLVYAEAGKAPARMAFVEGNPHTAPLVAFDRRK